MGQFIQEMFEAQMRWNNDGIVFYYTGRDVVAIMIGFLSGMIFIGIVMILKELEKELKEKRQKK